jgi:hypothetical protein
MAVRAGLAPAPSYSRATPVGAQAFADTYALHLVTLTALESFSAAIARSGISSEIRYRPSAGDDSGSSSARAFATPVEQHLDASSSTSSPPTGVLKASWSTLLSYVTPSAPLAILATSPLGPTTPAEPRLFDRSPEGLIHRFRPNVVLAPISTQAPFLANKEWPHEDVYPEDDWGALTIGSEDADESVDRWDMRVVGRCGRCTVRLWSGALDVRSEARWSMLRCRLTHRTSPYRPPLDPFPAAERRPRDGRAASDAAAQDPWDRPAEGGRRGAQHPSLPLAQALSVADSTPCLSTLGCPARRSASMLFPSVVHPPPTALQSSTERTRERQVLAKQADGL